jgi:hypothetical protein
VAPKNLIPDNGIVERFHKTFLDEFYPIAFRKKIYGSIAEMQSDLDEWMAGQRAQAPSGAMVLRKRPRFGAVTMAREN